MKALLLAAGLGERLRPLTNTIPKCLVPIHGMPLLGYWLRMLDHAGINHFYINLHYHADAVLDFVQGSDYAKRVTFLTEEKLLGTGGTLKRNADLFLEDTFFLAHADNLCLTDFPAFFKAHQNRPKNAALTMMTFDPPDLRSCGVVVLDENNMVQEFHEKVENPPTNLANGAVFVMEPEVALFAKNTEKEHFEISRDILPAYVGRILAWHNGDYHLDIGTPETYKKAQDDRMIVQKLYKKFGGADLAA
jgi:mannose-1-phosphate guanylyltransferase